MAKKKRYYKIVVSKQEIRVASILEALGIKHKRNVWVGGFNYDFHLIGYGNLLLEYQGDYWHANPAIYNARDKIKYPGKTKLASTVWKHDYLKQSVAARNGYTVIYLWESEAKGLTDEEVAILLLKKMPASQKEP